MRSTYGMFTALYAVFSYVFSIVARADRIVREVDARFAASPLPPRRKKCFKIECVKACKDSRFTLFQFIYTVARFWAVEVNNRHIPLFQKGLATNAPLAWLLSSWR